MTNGEYAPFTSRDRVLIRSRPSTRRTCDHLMKALAIIDVTAESHPTAPSGIGNGYEERRKSGTGSHRPGRGTSLVELLVVLALLSVMVLVASDLVVHSMKLLGATGRSVRNPLVVHVTSRLRHDVQEAAGLQREQWVWCEEPLVLVKHDGSFVRIALEDGNLVRETAGGSAGPSDSRVILRGVTSLWWRMPVEGVVDLNIGYLVYPAPESQASRDVGYGQERRHENLRFTIRGGGGGTQW